MHKFNHNKILKIIFPPKNVRRTLFILKTIFKQHAEFKHANNRKSLVLRWILALQGLPWTKLPNIAPRVTNPHYPTSKPRRAFVEFRVKVCGALVLTPGAQQTQDACSTCKRATMDQRGP